MSDPGQSLPTTPVAPELNFDRLEPTVSIPNDATASNAEGIVCSACGSTMLDEYYSVGGRPICATCRAAVEASRAASRAPKAFGKAFAFGLGAALAGAVVYYAVIALLDLEIGIVAILIGWMVGRAIQKALPGGGSRRYQVLAALLTYFAVGCAYVPLVFKARSENAVTKQQDSTAVAAPQVTSASSPAAATKSGADDAAHGDGKSLLFGVGALLALAFSLPVVATFSSGGGIISALIIAIGMRQAWRMAGAHTVPITGPFRVGGPAVAAGAS